MSTKKRIKPGKLEPGSDGCTILVHFTTEITHLDEEGNACEVEKVPGSREVQLCKALYGLAVGELADVAQDICSQCRYIPASKTQQVEHLLAKMHAKANGKSHGDGDRRRHSKGFARIEQDEHWAPAASTNGSSSSPSWRVSDFLPYAEPRDVEDYAEALYEERMEAKALGARKILRLCADAQLLPQVAGHGSLLGVLSRELRESAKRSHELAIAITGIFLCLAHFAKFHSALNSNQCGEAAMRVLEYESKRRATLRKELKLHQGEMVARGSAATAEQRQKLDREEQNYRSVMERQDGLLLLCVMILRSLADDLAVEKKLVANKICHSLGPLLSRHSEDLLLAVLGFLHKLSIFVQTKDQLVHSQDVMTRLADLSGHANTEVALWALRLCYNLCFDARGRVAFLTQTSLLDKVSAACQQAISKKIAFKLLYMLSLETSHRSCIAKQCAGCIALTIQLCSKCKDNTMDPELAALCVNFATDEACAAVLVKSDGFAKVIVRGIQHADVLLLKVLRHVAGHAAVWDRLLSAMAQAEKQWLHRLVQLAKICTDQAAVRAEALGVLSALHCRSDVVPWPELCENGLMDLLHRLLVPSIDEDVSLECIMIVGTLALDTECQSVLLRSNVPRLLVELIPEKEADSDMTLQLLFAVRCMLSDPGLGRLVCGTEAPGYVVQILQALLDEEFEMQPRVLHELQRLSEDILDSVKAVERACPAQARWSDEIKAYRFERHNREWCRRAAGDDSGVSRGPSPDPASWGAGAGSGVSDYADVSTLMSRTKGGAGATGFGITNGHKSTRHR